MSRWVIATAAACALVACSAKFDPEVGRKYPCDPQAERADCPGGFVCGLEGFCHDRNERAAWLCRDDSDCPQLEGEAWHCGFPQGFDNPMRCYDRNQAGAQACRYDAGVEDCAPFWKCGLASRCHDATPATYACASDLDCEGGWRCSVDGVCRDTAAMGLRPNLPLQQLERTRVSPELPEDVIDFTTRMDSRGEADGYAAVRDGGVTWVQFFYFSREVNGKRVYAQRVDQTVVPTPSSVLLYADQALSDGRYQDVYPPYVASGSSLSSYYDALTDPEGRAAEVAPIPEGAQLRQLPSGWSTEELWLATGGSSFSTFAPGSQAESDVSAGPDAGTPWTFSDVAWMPGYPNQDCSDCKSTLLAGTSVGLMLAPRGDQWLDAEGNPAFAPQLVPVTAPLISNGACSSKPTGVRRVRVFDSYPDDFLGVEVARDGGSEIILEKLDQSGSPPAASCAALPTVDAPSVCPACPPGGTLVEFGIAWPSYGKWENQVVVRSVCNLAGADGGAGSGVFVSPRFQKGACTLEQDTGAALPPVAWRSTATTPGHSDFIDGAGRPWVSYVDNDPGNPYPELMTFRPEVLFGDPESAWFAGMRPVELEDGGYRTELWKREPGVGMVFAERAGQYCLTNDQLLASVRSRPDWFLAWEPQLQSVSVRESSDLETGVDWDPWAGELYCLPMAEPVAHLQGTSSIELHWPDRPRFFADTAETADGGTALVVAGGDRLWAADVTGRADGSSKSEVGVPVRAVPLPYATIESLAVLSPDPARPRYLAGYLLANQRLFQFEAATPERFDTREIEVPGELVAVFADEFRGRIGTRSGEVYSLPEPVLLAKGPLAPDDPEAQDYGTVCGDTFALGRRGVYRLDTVEGSAVGQWRRLDVSSMVPVDPTLAGFDDGRFHRTKDALYAITGQGMVYRLGYERCERQ